MRYTLKPYIRLDRINSKGECPVNIRYTFQRKILNVPVGIVIQPKFWNDDIDYPIQNNTYNFKEVIRKIDQKQTEIENQVSEYYRRYMTYPNIQELKQLLTNDPNYISKTKNLSITKNLEDYIELLNRTPTVSPNTIKVFKTTLRHFTGFEKENNKSFTVYDINKSVLEKFSSYLYFKDLQISSVGKYVKAIKIFLNKFVIEELNLDINQTYRNVKIVKEERTKRDVLTLHELELLKYNVFYSNYNVEEYNKENRGLKLTKYELTEKEILIGKIFLMLCSTGLSFIDLMKLNFFNFHKIDLTELMRKNGVELKKKANKKDAIDHGIIIKIERTKMNTDNECIIPVFGITLDLITSELFRIIGGVELEGDIAESLNLSEKKRLEFFWKVLQRVIKMKENGRINNDKVFTTISNQFFNREIKLLFKKIGVNSIESITKRDRNKTTIIKHKYDLISSHTGRRTYISINLQKGIRPDTLMRTTGHKSYETMMIYVQQQQDSIFRELYDKIEN